MGEGKRGSMSDFPRDVDGWLTPEQGRILAELATDKVCLEIGSYQGKSTICMAQTAKHVHSVDWHQGGPEIRNHGDTLLRLRNNLAVYCCQNVTLHVGRI